MECGCGGSVWKDVPCDVAADGSVVGGLQTVFSLVGVLGITLVLFFVVALSARLILGR